MGQHLEFVGTKKETSDLGYTSNKSLYQAMARELLTSDEGLMLRSRKSIESEVVPTEPSQTYPYYRGTATYK